MAINPTHISNREIRNASFTKICKRCGEPMTRFDRLTRQCDECVEAEIFMNEGNVNYETLLHYTD